MKLTEIVAVLMSLASSVAFSQKADSDSAKTYESQEEVVVIESRRYISPRDEAKHKLEGTLYHDSFMKNTTNPSISMSAPNLAALFNFRGAPSDNVTAYINGLPSFANIFIDRGLRLRFSSQVFYDISVSDLTSASQIGPSGIIDLKFIDFTGRKFGSDVSLQLFRQYAMVNIPVSDMSFTVYADNDAILIPELKKLFPKSNSVQLLVQGDVWNASYMKFIERHDMTTNIDNKDVTVGQKASHDLATGKYAFGNFSVAGLFEAWSQTITHDKDRVNFGTYHYGLATNIRFDNYNFGLNINHVTNKNDKDIKTIPEYVDRVFFSELERQDIDPFLRQTIIIYYYSQPENERYYHMDEILERSERNYMQATGINPLDDPDYVNFKKDFFAHYKDDISDQDISATIYQAYADVEQALFQNSGDILKLTGTLGVSVLRSNYTVPYGVGLKLVRSSSDFSLQYMYTPVLVQRNDLDKLYSSNTYNAKANNISLTANLYPSAMDKITFSTFYKDYHQEEFGRSIGLEFLAERYGDVSYKMSAFVQHSKLGKNFLVGSIPAGVNVTLSYKFSNLWTGITSLTWQKGMINKYQDYKPLNDKRMIDLAFSYTTPIFDEARLEVSIAGYNLLGWHWANELVKDGNNLIMMPVTGSLMVRIKY